MYATSFSPSQFYRGMGVNEIVLSTSRNDFLLTTFESDSIVGRLMHMEGLGIGLDDDRINYVETYPAMTERKLSAAEFTPVIGRTPEESANEGQHEYLVVIYMDNELFDSYNAAIEMEFTDEKVCITENGEVYCFLRVAENHYTTEDGLTQMALILDGFIWNIDDEDSQMEVLFSRVGE